MKKTLTVLLALVLVIAMSVAGTMAYLTSTDTVTNTFTVGKVQITMDEADVNEYGQKLNADGNVAQENDTLATRVDKNTYKLIPGHEYVKDPIVHVDADSENSWVFVKVTNDISAIIDTANTLDAQIEANHWTKLETGVYYKEYTKGQDDKDLEVFESFKLTGNADVASYNAQTIVVNAYAIQKDGFDTPAAAWAELNPAPATTPTTPGT